MRTTVVAAAVLAAAMASTALSGPAGAQAYVSEDRHALRLCVNDARLAIRENYRSEPEFLRNRARIVSPSEIEVTGSAVIYTTRGDERLSFVCYYDRYSEQPFGTRLSLY